MRVVVDTNIFVASLSSRSAFHWVIKSFISENFTLVITNDILLEYEEKLREKYSNITVESFLETLNIAVNIQKIDVYYNWNLISDVDDNKFSDCVIQSGADYLVTEDRDFNVLKQIDFPKVTVVNLEEFKKILGVT